ncbi:MAG: tyrosine-type recombinase/integrase [Nitrososphaeraceae archaeon]
MIGELNPAEAEFTQNLHKYAENNSHKHRIYPVTEGIPSPFTQKAYQRSFDRFRKYVKIQDEQVLLDFSPKVIKQMIVDYILYLRDEKPGKKLGRSSIKTHISAILHFFQINNDDFNLTMKNFRIHLPANDQPISQDRPYTRDEIASILKDADVRTKVVIELLCSSGMRMGALNALRIGDLTKLEYQNIDLYRIQIYSGTRDAYFSLCTPECYNAITDYISYRQRSGEDLEDKSPLIREQFNKDNPFTVNAPKFVTGKAIEYLIDHALERSGMRKVHEVHMSHGFRKFFVSTCESSGMKSLHVSMLAGHDTGIKKAYYIPNESIILEDYMTHAADSLTIDPSYKLRTRVKDLESQQNEEIIQLKGAHDDLERRMFLVMSEMRKFKARRLMEKKDITE